MSSPHDSLPEPGDDRILKEMLAHLKRLEPPLETRIASRAAVAAELSVLGHTARQSRLPWWRRSISLPVPIAASLLVLTAIAMGSSAQNWFEEVPEPVTAEQPVSAPAVGSNDTALIATNRRASKVTSKYYVAETYLCGIGRVSSESRYFDEEQNHE